MYTFDSAGGVLVEHPQDEVLGLWGDTTVSLGVALLVTLAKGATDVSKL